MSKYHSIRWKPSDEKELARVVRNFNAKVNRLAKKNPQLKNALPEKTSVGQLKELITTRQDLKRELNALKRFSKRGAETIVIVDDTDYNIKTTKWQRTEMNRRIAIINRKRKRRLEELQDLEMTSRGEPLGYTKGQYGMGRAKEVSLRPMNAFTRRMTQTDLRWKWKAILTESQSDYFNKKDYQVRENYIKGLEENYNPNDVKDIIKAIKEMDIQDFLVKFESEGGTMEFASGPPSSEGYGGYVGALKSTWLPNRMTPKTRKKRIPKLK